MQYIDRFAALSAQHSDDFEMRLGEPWNAVQEPLANVAVRYCHVIPATAATAISLKEPPYVRHCGINYKFPYNMD